MFANRCKFQVQDLRSRFPLLMLAVVAIQGGCSDPGASYPARVGSYAQSKRDPSIAVADLGVVSGGLAEPKSEMLSLVRADGSLSLAEVVKESDLIVDVSKAQKCSLTPGTKVAMIALNGIYVRVRGKANCDNVVGPDVEGFVTQYALKELVGAVSEIKVQVPTMVATSSQNTFVATSAKKPPEPSTPVSSSQVPSSQVQNYAGCTWIYALIPDRVHLKESFAYPGPGKNMCDNGGSCSIMSAALDNTSIVIEGQAAKFRVDMAVSSVGVFSSETHDSSEMVDGKLSLGLHETLVRYNGLGRRLDKSFSISAVALDANGKAAGNSCRFTMQWISPVVLDLNNAGRFEGVDLGNSRVAFDLMGDGRKVRTGWVKPSMGFLAIDRDRSGIIESGEELFGSGTVLENGIRALNGYVALAELDSNHDGMITADDAQFQKLVVWIDANENGFSEVGEIHSLSAMRIERVSIVYGPSHRQGSPEFLSNDVRYESRFWGPAKCGNQGCLSFDVFFATAKAQAFRR